MLPRKNKINLNKKSTKADRHNHAVMYSPSVWGCSLGSEAGTSAGQHLLPPPTGECTLGLDSGGVGLQAKAAGWPEGSERSC